MSFRRFVPSFRILDTKRVFGAFLNRRSHHPGAGVGPPSRACACPSSAEEGSKISNLHITSTFTFMILPVNLLPRCL